MFHIERFELLRLTEHKIVLWLKKCFLVISSYLITVSNMSHSIHINTVTMHIISTVKNNTYIQHFLFVLKCHRPSLRYAETNVFPRSSW